MAMPTFIPPMTPSPGLTDTPEFAVTTAAFGDGYQQSTANSLNNIRRILDATWEVLSREEAAQIVAFFRARKGSQPFRYRFPHDDQEAKWTVETYTDTIISGDYHRLSATFRQSFTLAT